MIDYRRVECAHDGCVRWVSTLPNLRRVAVGWYFDRDGSVLCPAHLPAELAEFMGGKS